MKGRTEIVGVLLAASLVAIFVLAGCKAAPPEEVAPPPEEKPEVITWNFHSGYAESYQLGAVHKVFKDIVEEKTDGQLKIDIFYSAGLGYKGAEIMSVLREGLLEAAEVAGPVYAPEVGTPWWSFEDFYATFDNWDQQEYVHARTYPMQAKDIEDYGGVVPLVFHNAATRDTIEGFWTNKKLESLEDLKGLTVRVYYPLAREYQFEPLGMEAIWVAGAETYQALKTGLVDVVLHSMTAGVSSHYYEVAKYFYAWEPRTTGLWGVVCSKKAFDALPEDMQKAVLEAGKEAQDLVSDEVFKYPNKYVTGRKYVGEWTSDMAAKYLKEQGNELYRVDKLNEVFVKLGREGLKTWADEEGYVKAQKAYDYMMEALEKYPGIENEVYLGLEPLVFE